MHHEHLLYWLTYDKRSMRATAEINGIHSLDEIIVGYVFMVKPRSCAIADASMHDAIWACLISSHTCITALVMSSRRRLILWLKQMPSDMSKWNDLTPSLFVLLVDAWVHIFVISCVAYHPHPHPYPPLHISVRVKVASNDSVAALFPRSWRHRINAA